MLYANIPIIARFILNTGNISFTLLSTFLENTGRNIILCARMLLLNQEYIDWTGELMMQSRENGEKPQLGQFFEDIEAIYLEIANFSQKEVLFKFKVIFSTNFRSKTKIIVRAIFEKNITVSDFGLIWRLFREYLQIKIIFRKSGSVTFLNL